MISPANMCSFLLPIALWIWNLFNAASCRCMMMLKQYSVIINLQNIYIKKLEHHDMIAQVYIAKAYIRAARAHFNKGELIQTVDKCMMAIYTYRYNKSKAYRLCWNAYRILATNSPDFNRNIFWENEVNEEEELLREYFENNKQ